jgi:hypothetical protein
MKLSWNSSPSAGEYQETTSNRIFGKTGER